MTSTVFDDGIIRLIHGDAIEALRELPAESVDAIVTDPPYGLEFMGKTWDRFEGIIPGRGARIQEERAAEMTETGKGHTGSKGPYLAARVDQFIAGTPYQEWCTDWARECLRVLKPGGYLLAFGGTRTYHRLGCAIEDAGFEIRDCLVWGYMSGFPKSHDVSKAIDRKAGAEREVVGKYQPPAGGEWNLEQAESENVEAAPGTFTASGRRTLDITAPATPPAQQWAGWGTALKPAWEPIVMARKPVRGTVASNVLEYGTGALNIGASRIPVQDGEGDPSAERKAHGYSEAAKKALGATVAAESATGFSGEVVGSDSSAGRWPANVMLTDPIYDGDFPDEVAGGGSSESGFMAAGTQRATRSVDYGVMPDTANLTDTYADGGGKSRFFLVPKADRSERERGLRGEPQDAGMHNGTRRLPDTRERSQHDLPQRINTHPTVKPLDLMVHLVKLVTPPGGTVVDPFVGSGTTMLAASELGFKGIGIDQSAEYLAFAEGRLMATPIGMGLVA